METEESNSVYQHALPLVSVVIISFNYGRYLKQAIESALSQGWPALEVIVVDDGSTDDSRAVIETFDSRIVPVFKQHGGEASAMNRGFLASRGTIVVFLDSDDYLLPGAILTHAQAMQDSDVVRSQGYLTVVDANGAPNGQQLPGRPAAEGDLRDLVLDIGPGAYVSTPQSGNAWSRRFLEKICPLPECGPLGAEPFLMDAAPLFGAVATTEKRVGAYRIHNASMTYHVAAFTLRNVSNVLDHYEIRASHLATVAQSLGYRAASERWLARNWRILTLKYLRSRLSATDSTPAFVEHVDAVWTVRRPLAKRLALMAMVIALRATPTAVSVALAKSIINLRYM